LRGSPHQPRTEICVIFERELCGCAPTGQGERGFGFVDLILIKLDGLVEALGAGGLKSGLLELFDGEGLCFTKPFASGFAALQRIVGEDFYVGPPTVAVKMNGGCLLRRCDCGCKKEREDRDGLTNHGLCLQDCESDVRAYQTFCGIAEPRD